MSRTNYVTHGRKATEQLSAQILHYFVVMNLVCAVLQEVQDSPEQLTVHVSQFEVYNEQIYDLLAEEAGAVLGQRPALRLKEDSQGRIFVRGLSEVRASQIYMAIRCIT